MAIQMLYQSDLGHMSPQTVFASFKPAEYLQERASSRRSSSADLEPVNLDEAFAYAQTLVNGTQEHLEEIDGIIRRQAEHWRLERMPAVDRNILRLAVFELLDTETPKRVVINEALEIAKRYSAPDAVGFVNGVLDAIGASIEAASESR